MDNDKNQDESVVLEADRVAVGVEQSAENPSVTIVQSEETDRDEEKN